MPGGDNGRRFCLSNAPLGATSVIKQYNFKYQVPVWFFDREISSGWETPLKNLEEEASKYEDERVAQPFESENEPGEDLLKHLLNSLSKPKESNITIIIAPAGYGKTVLMSSLYTKLRERFMQAKSEQALAMRPLMMLPGHVKRADDLDSLINNFIGAEYEYGVASAQSFRFWVTQGFAVWLLDGLEELILKNPEIISKILEDYIYALDSTAPQILISIRKPLLGASPELREAINDWKGSGITLYELSEWGDTQKENYFRKNLSPHLDVSGLINQVKTSPTLRGLCNVPYYCNLITELNNENKMKVFNDDTELVEYAFERICEREFGKGLDEQICPVEKQKQLFSILALESFKLDGVFGRESLREWAEMSIPDGLADDIKHEQLSCLERHAVLSVTGDNVNFVHDILRQFLIGDALLDELTNNMINEFDSGEIEPRSFVHRYLSKKTIGCNWAKITMQLSNLKSSPQSDARGFRNILNIYLSTPVERKEEKIRLLVNNTNLSGLIFKGLNLTEFNFHNSKLSSTEFIDCDLTEAEFDGCTFKDTLLSNRCLLPGASIRDAALESIRVDGRQVYDLKEIQKFFYEKAQVLVEMHNPCQPAINVKKMFEKFIRKGKGFKLPYNFIANTKLGGGTQATDVIDAAVKEGYLAPEGGRVKIKINLYEEVAKYIDSFLATQGIKKILDSVCTDVRVGCRHV